MPSTPRIPVPAPVPAPDRHYQPNYPSMSPRRDEGPSKERLDRPKQSGGLSSYQEQQRKANQERAEYWKERGHNFNPEYMTAYSMDRKVQDIERAKYWKEKGHNFNPEHMTAYAMDRKVQDIESAKYWDSKGLHFNPEYMTAYSMDREAQKQLRK